MSFSWRAIQSPIFAVEVDHICGLTNSISLEVSQKMTFRGKLVALVRSRRFLASVSAVLVVVFQDLLSLDESQANTLVAVVMGWVVGDSISKTGEKDW